MTKTEYDTGFARATLFYVFLNYLWFFANIIEISAANYKYLRKLPLLYGLVDL